MGEEAAVATVPAMLGADLVVDEMDMLEGDWVETVSGPGGKGEVILLRQGALAALAREAFLRVNHFFRPSFLDDLRRIADDDDASDNDRFMALELLRNACISAEREFPSCQDTGTGIVLGVKGERVMTGGADEADICSGIRAAYAEGNFRESQLVSCAGCPAAGSGERNTRCNLPAQVDVFAAEGEEIRLAFIAKGGGSANKTALFQESPALLRPGALAKFLKGKLCTLGSAACPPYRLAVAVGGMSAEVTLRAVLLASCGLLDGIPQQADGSGTPYRDTELEETLMTAARDLGLGAQFGGKYMCRAVRVIRLSRHGASLPIGLGVGCSADRQIVGRVGKDGVWIERLETNPARFLPVPRDVAATTCVDVSLGDPEGALSLIRTLHVGQRLSLSGPMLVARDAAHARWCNALDAGQPLPDYVRGRAILYAGPSRTPPGKVCGSIGPTTSARMDSFLPIVMPLGGSLISIGKGNRSTVAADACRANKGCYLGVPGGVAASIAECITKMEVIDFEELGMEAVRLLEVVRMPAFLIIDTEGNDLYADWLRPRP